MNRNKVPFRAAVLAPVNLSRRNTLIRLTAAGVAAAALAAWRPQNAHAETMHLSEDDPQAKALAYVHDATSLDTARYPQRSSSEMICRNCALYVGEAGSAWGKCAIFPGKSVSAEGWCTAYAARKE